MSASALTTDMQSQFDTLAKYDCKIKEGSVGPGVVPSISKFNDLQCQTFLTALTGAKDNLLNCKTEMIFLYRLIEV